MKYNTIREGDKVKIGHGSFSVYIIFTVLYVHFVTALCVLGESTPVRNCGI
jgi:hypothetical protein